MAYYSSDDTAGELGGWIGNFIANLVFTAIFVFITIVVMEVLRIFKSHPIGEDTDASRLIRYATWGFVGCIGLSLVLLAIPATRGMSPYPGSLGFLLWVICLEWADVNAEMEIREKVNEDPPIDDLLEPWRFKTTPNIATNGEVNKEQVKETEGELVGTSFRR
jgi:hypothetical protein